MNNNELDLNLVFKMIADGKITELEAERLINAKTRLDSHVPTGLGNNPNQKH